MKNEGQIKESEQVLREAGIKGEKVQNLARLEWLDPKTIRAIIFQAVQIEGQTIGLAIWRMEHNQHLYGKEQKETHPAYTLLEKRRQSHE